MRKRKKYTAERLRQLAESATARKEREAEARRKLLAGLSPEAAELALREFAKLGLTQ